MIFKLILFLFLSLSAFSNSENKFAYIAFFNTLRLGKVDKDYEHLAKSIEPFDLIGLAEVMDKKGLFRLLSELNKISTSKWAYFISPYPVGTDNYKEYYAYVYKKNKVEFIKSEGFYPDTDNNFIRELFAVTFKIDNFDFTYVLMHSIYGKKITQRQLEASKLVNVYNYFQSLDPNEQDIIIGGDFNLSVTDSSFDSLLNHEDNIIFCIDPSIKTTIGTKGFANSYDNIFISKKFTKEFTGESGALDITNGDYIRTRKEVSDHLPVFIKVNTEFDDD